MEITEEYLRHRYSSMSTEELIDIELTSDLTELATRVIEDIFVDRGVTNDERSASSYLSTHTNSIAESDLSFGWWLMWAWLRLTFGNLMIFLYVPDMPELSIILVVVNSAFMVMILRYNKYAFMFATIISLNPLLWIINGIYLKNRWRHPKVNKSKIVNEVASIIKNQIIAATSVANKEQQKIIESGDKWRSSFVLGYVTGLISIGMQSREMSGNVPGTVLQKVARKVHGRNLEIIFAHLMDHLDTDKAIREYEHGQNAAVVDSSAKSTVPLMLKKYLLNDFDFDVSGNIKHNIASKH